MDKDKKNFTDKLKSIMPDGLSRRLIGGDGFEIHSGGRRIKFEQLEADSENGILRFKEVNGALHVECLVQLQPDYSASRWELRLTNHGALPTDPIDQLSLLSLSFEGPRVLWRVITAHGGTTEYFYPPFAYRTEEQIIYSGYWGYSSYVEIESHQGGRSSNKNIPLMIATHGEDEQSPGFFCGLEWSANWFIRLVVSENGGIIEAGPKVKGLVLEPGEALYLPAVHIGFFEGGGQTGTNALRQYIHECIGARYEGNLVIPPVSYDHWFGIDTHFDESLLRRQVDRAAEIGIEFFVVDAGWFPGDFPYGVGNWDSVDSKKFPNGLKPFAEYVRSKGMEFGLWVEPERASADTWAVRNYPQLFVETPHPDLKERPQFHINLALQEAQDWMIETIGGWIDRLDIRWSRWDYNIDPQPVWEKIDPTGKIQFAYMAGLYRVLDTLMREHPHLFIECSSSGGRRLDLGIVRRAHTCWFSDHSSEPHICRYMQARSNQFWPGNFAESSVPVNLGEGDGRFSDISILSRMVGTLSFDGDIASWSKEWTSRVAALVIRYKEIRHLLVQDFYQLSPMPATDRDWDIIQFVARDGSEGLIFAFRCRGETVSMQVHPHVLESRATYLLKNLVDGAETSVSGKQFSDEGIQVTLEFNSSVLWHYRKVSSIKRC